MSKYGRKPYICRKKETPPPKKCSKTIWKIAQIFVASLLLLDVVNEWLCIIVFIVNKLNCIYFTWFVHTFVNYKYNAHLKRADVCLMPLSTLVTLSRFDEGKEIRIVRSKMA